MQYTKSPGRGKSHRPWVDEEPSTLIPPRIPPGDAHIMVQVHHYYMIGQNQRRLPSFPPKKHSLAQPSNLTIRTTSPTLAMHPLNP
ncbi:hypothetical protein M430DRAFT_165907 [Amorphotheca resinae ATCC 22711]|uniref:Uncharacterized protein n=1 Tax=Amorphotheca resinae ATCC 22711 TaxID=857342 RepID=A0A2T3BG25_AMORE|nr:hypothetical protein M430DRAFT_165907 [Amorphotheca resinae ATCC 22711]PSS28332.1 hypothetical protein M430DRAFT_165907 [Amorphotheca resinae ATCC 22711]